MRNITNNFWKIKNEYAKNLIVFIAVIIVSFIAIIASSILVGLVNIVWFSIFNPNMENLRDTATQLVNTSQTWNLINEVLRGILIIILIKLLYKYFNKSKLSLSGLGLNFDKQQPIYFVLGVVLMFTMFIGSLYVNTNSETVVHNLSIVFSTNSVLLTMFIAFANAFWQEVAFRGFLQKRLINSYGVIAGIIITSFLFVIIHGLARDINLIEIILGTVLFTLVGIIFYLTNSIWISTAIHATGNFFLRSFSSNDLFIPEQLYRLLVYGVCLIVVLIVFRKRIIPALSIKNFIK